MLILNLEGRRTPYTPRGLRRMVCVRCRRFRAVEQWSLDICSLGFIRWFALCLNCDVRLNAMILRFWQTHNGEEITRLYLQRKLKQHGRPQRVKDGEFKT
jgi:hypothetical protein